MVKVRMHQADKKNIGLVSVIVVCYNEKPENIEKTLSSIINQNYQEVELIVIDGKSNEDTIKCLNKFKKNISVFLSESDQGIYDAMNKGVSRSTGEWVIFMNIGDSFYSDNTLLKSLESINDEYDIFYGDIYREDMCIVSKPPKYINRFTFYSTYFCHQSLLFRRVLFDQIGLFNITYKLLADRDWIYKAYLHGAKFKYKSLTICRYEGGGVSTSPQIVKSELMEMRKKSFSKQERAFFLTLNFFVKFYRRLVTANFKTPIAIKKIFTSRI